MSYVGQIAAGITGGYMAVALVAGSAMLAEGVAERAGDDTKGALDGPAFAGTIALGALGTAGGAVLAATNRPVAARVGGAALALAGVGALVGIASGVMRRD